MKTTLITGDVSEYVLAELETQGLGIKREVDLSHPEMPEDITALSDEDLMLLYTSFSMYSDFVNTQLSCAVVDEKTLERTMDYVESSAMVRVQSENVKTPVTTLKAMVDRDPEVVEARSNHMYKYAYRKMLETMANNCERSSAVCSRELTRRTSGDNFKTRTRKFTV